MSKRKLLKYVDPLTPIQRAFANGVLWQYPGSIPDRSLRRIERAAEDEACCRYPDPYREIITPPTPVPRDELREALEDAMKLVSVAHQWYSPPDHQWHESAEELIQRVAALAAHEGKEKS